MGLKKELLELRNVLFGKYSHQSYSQEGEDMVLNRLFDGRSRGFYVDVGAHHPMRFSNTYFFYKQGWRGINIDPMPGIMKKFDRYRPRDINLELGISSEAKKLTYHMFNDPALNGFDASLTENRENQLQQYHVINRIPIQTLPLSQVLEKYLPQGQVIDFLSIDVEGLDLDVLKSNDWTRFKPKVVLVEALEIHMNNPLAKPTLDFMENLGYRIRAKTVNTAIFTMRGESWWG